MVRPKGNPMTSRINAIAKGEAPRITVDAIHDQIVAKNFFTAAEGALGAGTGHTPPMELLTFCVLTLRNGFTVVGKSACASPENYDQNIGQEIAFKNAFDQIWALMGYELRSQLTNLSRIKPSLAEAATRLLAYKLDGNAGPVSEETIDTILEHIESQGTPTNE
jgi:hypothetical protein